MANLTLGNQSYDTLFDKEKLLEKIHAALNGEDVPGMIVLEEPKLGKPKEDTATESAASFPLITILLIGGLAVALLSKRPK